MTYKHLSFATFYYLCFPHPICSGGSRLCYLQVMGKRGKWDAEYIMEGMQKKEHSAFLLWLGNDWGTCRILEFTTWPYTGIFQREGGGGINIWCMARILLMGQILVKTDKGTEGGSLPLVGSTGNAQVGGLNEWWPQKLWDIYDVLWVLESGSANSLFRMMHLRIFKWHWMGT